MLRSWSDYESVVQSISRVLRPVPVTAILSTDEQSIINDAKVRDYTTHPLQC